jgi:hemerythrin-like metal-binding protein
MNGDMPERWTNSDQIDQQHRQLMDELELLLLNAASGSADAMAKQFAKFCDMVTAHFKYEEEVLSDIGSELLSVQQEEHGLLSRMLENMRGLMESSEQKQWRANVIGEAIDALVLHVAKEDESFAPLTGRRRR